MLRYMSMWGSFKKCLAAVTHEYFIAVERICNPVIFVVVGITNYVYIYVKKKRGFSTTVVQQQAFL